MEGGSPGKRAVQDAESPRLADNVSCDPQNSNGIEIRLRRIVQPVHHCRTPVGQWRRVCHRTVATTSRILPPAERSVPLARRHLQRAVASTTKEVSPPSLSHGLREILLRREPVRYYSASVGEQSRFQTKLRLTSGGRARLAAAFQCGIVSRRRNTAIPGR